MRLPRSTNATLVLFAVVACLGAIFLAAVGIDALEGRNTFQFYADSSTYYEVARGDLLDIDSPLAAFGIAGNFLGPLAILLLTGENYYLVLLFNVALAAASVLLIARTLEIDALRYSMVLLANPVMLSSMLSVNKEVLGFAALACLLYAYRYRSAMPWIAAVALSFLARWHMTLFVLALGALVTRANPLQRRRGWTLVLLLVGLSLMYVALADVLEPIRVNFEDSAKDYEGSGFYEWLVGLQEAGYYALIFPLKAAHLLFGLGLHFERLVSPENIYNDVVQLLHSTALLVLFGALLHRRRIRLGDDLIYMSALYLAVFVLSPIYTPRYLLPVYVLWAAALCARRPVATLFAPCALRRARRRRGTESLPLPTPSSS